MSLKSQHPATTKPATRRAYTCADYDPKPGSKQCRSYLPNGGCAHASRTMCEEWLKVNGGAARATAEETIEPAYDLFGMPLPTKPAPRKAARRPAFRSSPTAPAVAATKPTHPAAPVMRYPTEEELSSFRALDIAVCIASEQAGDVWIVPEYTGKERRELRVDHAATLAAVCAGFPGAKVASLEMLTTASAEKQS